MVGYLAESLHARLSDHEEHVRIETVTALCDVVCHSHVVVPVDTIKAVAVHLHDESVSFLSLPSMFLHVIDLYNLLLTYLKKVVCEGIHLGEIG